MTIDVGAPFMAPGCDESHPYNLFADLFRYPEKSSAAWQELYTRTFDVQAVCYLDIGYVLFGEDYKRGHFLVKMDQLQREYHNDCGTELSDHLPNVLTLLAKMGKTEETTDFVQKLLLPALDKMLQGFSQKGNIYETLLQALRDTLANELSPGACTRQGIRGTTGGRSHDLPPPTPPYKGGVSSSGRLA